MPLKLSSQREHKILGAMLTSPLIMQSGVTNSTDGSIRFECIRADATSAARTYIRLIYSPTRRPIGMHWILRIRWEIACWFRLDYHAPPSSGARIEMTSWTRPFLSAKYEKFLSQIIFITRRASTGVVRRGMAASEGMEFRCRIIEREKSKVIEPSDRRKKVTFHFRASRSLPPPLTSFFFYLSFPPYFTPFRPGNAQLGSSFGFASPRSSTIPCFLFCGNGYVFLDQSLLLGSRCRPRYAKADDQLLLCLRWPLQTMTSRKISSPSAPDKQDEKYLVQDLFAFFSLLSLAPGPPMRRILSLSWLNPAREITNWTSS